MSRVLMGELGFKRSAADHLVFFHQTKDEHIIIAVATDNMAVMSKRSVDAEIFKRNIKTFWDITNHRPIGWFLEFQIK